MTDASPVGKRASVRTTRANVVNQERKDEVEAVESILLPAEALATSGSDTTTNQKETSSASASVVSPSENGANERFTDTSSEQTGGRRSARRTAVVVASAPAKTPQQSSPSGATAATATVPTTTTTAASSAAASDAPATSSAPAISSSPSSPPSPKTNLSVKDTEAVVAFVLNGGSIATAATRFNLTRGKVTKILKENAVTSDNSVVNAAIAAEEETAAAAKGHASDSTETASEEGSQEGSTTSTAKKGSSQRSIISAEDALAKVAAAVAKTPTAAATVKAVTGSMDVVMAAAPAAPLALPVSQDLKRGSAAMHDLSSGAHSGHPGSPMPKAKRVRKSREEKLAILAFVDDGGTHVAAAEKFGVSRTAVTKMVKERDIIMSGVTGKHTTSTASGTPVAVAGAAAAAATGTAGLATGAASQASQIAASLGVVVAGSMGDGSSMPVTRKTQRGAGSSATTPPTTSSTPSASGTGATRQLPPSGASTTTPTATGSAAAAPPPPNPKARRVRKTNEEKLMILEFVERGGSQGAAAEKFGVSRTAVTKMVKEKDAIMAQVMSGKSNHRKVLQYQHKLSIIEDMLYKWQVQVENDAPTLKITGDLLQSKAVEFRDKILTEWKGSLEPDVVDSLSDFKASNGWLHRYLQRRNLRTASKREYHRRTGSTGFSVLPASPSSQAFDLHLFLNEVGHQLKPVPVNCIWNLDEIALRTTTLTAQPRQDMDTATQASSSGDRVTVTLLVNAAGEKFRPQVVLREPGMAKMDDGSQQQSGESKVFLSSQHPHAWQDTTTLALYLHTVSLEAKARNETWYVIMDASGAHLELAQLVDPSGSFERGFRFENLVLILLPPQTTQEHHAIHHGVARMFKAAYRQALLWLVLTKWQKWRPNSATTTTTTTTVSPETADNSSLGGSAVGSFSVQDHVTEDEALQLIGQAWDAVPTALIRHCWVRNGLLGAAQLASISQDNSRVVEAELFHALTEMVTEVRAIDGGALAQAIGLAVAGPPPPSSGGDAAAPDVVSSILDQVNALLTLDDHEPTERKRETLSGPSMNTTTTGSSSGSSQVITETDANGDLRALV